MNILEIKGLSKKFGDRQVIDNIDLVIPKNCIYGFLGQNGAGKTTTMKMITGLLPSDAGKITICGKPVIYGKHMPVSIGYLPDVPEFYEYMKPREYLALCGRISGLTSNQIRLKSDELLQLVGLEKENRRIKGFSRGMKQRLGIAQALLHEPELFLCDEPTSALDPLGRKELLDILMHVKEKTTVLFSTHILSDAERICDNIAVLHKGRIVMDGDLNSLKAQKRHDSIQIAFQSIKDANTYASYLMNMPNIKKIDTNQNICTLQVQHLQEMKEVLLSSLVEHHLEITRFEVQEPTLENLFMEVIA